MPRLRNLRADGRDLYKERSWRALMPHHGWQMLTGRAHSATISAMNPVASLHQLLSTLFNGDTAHLRRFLLFHEQGGEILQAFPGAQVSLAEQVDAAISQLQRRGLVGAALHALLTEFPRRRDEISRVIKLWSIDLTESNIANSSTESASKAAKVTSQEQQSVVVRNSAFNFNRCLRVRRTITLGELAQKVQKEISKTREIHWTGSGFALSLEFYYENNLLSPNSRLSNAGVEEGQVLDLRITITPQILGETWEPRTLNFSGVPVHMDDLTQELMLVEVFEHLQSAGFDDFE